MENQSRTKVILGALLFLLLAVVVFGLFWFFFLGPQTPVGLGWYLFSFAAGLTMIVLPCTLPLAFVIVPLSMGKGAAKGFGIALAFGLGVALTLSVYGIIAALVGEVAIGTIGAPLETVKNWLYFVAGVFAFLFAIGEIGLVNFRMPSYTGAAPAFIQRQGDYLKALLLGLFLGNIGVGCPHPATPVILTRIAASGDVFYGWALFFVHAVGRILPLLLLALLGILGVNALSWLMARREKVERATGWGMVYVAAFILVLGLFSHDWWVYSGQHTLLEELTQEERFLKVISEKIGVAPPHAHGLPTGTGLFGFPFWLGSWVLVFLWVLPFWWDYFKNKRSRLHFWLYLVLTLLLAQTFIWVLPDRFLNHTIHPGEAKHEELAAADFKIELEYENGVLDFVILDLKGGAITNPDILHERPLHVLTIRQGDLENFSHIHPELDPSAGHFKLAYTPPEDGQYHFWAEATYQGQTQTFMFGPFAFGATLEREAFPDFRRFLQEGALTYIFLRDENIRAERKADFVFKAADQTGRILRLGKYLGENAHIEIFSADLKHFHHLHASYGEKGAEHHGLIVREVFANGGEEHDPNELNFGFTFPEPGLYKIVIEFELEEDPGTYRKAEYWMEVAEGGFRIELSKTALIVISLVLIAVLLPLVNGYVNARE